VRRHRRIRQRGYRGQSNHHLQPLPAALLPRLQLPVNIPERLRCLHRGHACIIQEALLAMRNALGCEAWQLQSFHGHLIERQLEAAGMLLLVAGHTDYSLL